MSEEKDKLELIFNKLIEEKGLSFNSSLNPFDMFKMGVEYIIYNEEVLNKIINDLDSYSYEVDKYSFGLPINGTKYMEEMKHIIKTCIER